jgi:hypothetical protein
LYISAVLTTSKLAENAWNMNHIFEFDRARPIRRERLGKARKCHEVMEIYLGGQNVVSAPSMDLDPGLDSGGDTLLQLCNITHFRLEDLVFDIAPEIKVGWYEVFRPGSPHHESITT